jgi:DNA polymerase II
LDSANTFILTGEWVDYKGENILRFIGVSENSRPVEFIITKNRPYLFIPAGTSIPENDISFDLSNLNLKEFDGKKVDKISFQTRRDLKTFNEKLNEAGIITYEADLDPVRRFLMDHFINAQVEVRGESKDVKGLRRFVDPSLEKCEMIPSFKVLSLDIETGVRNNKLYSIGLHLFYSANGTGDNNEIKRVFMLCDKDETLSDIVTAHKSEADLLSSFLNWFKEVDPDIIIGWHVIGFDLMFLENKCKELFIDFNLARGKGRTIFRERKPAGFFASVSGRIIIDGPPSLRSSFFTFEDFKLETIARELLKEGKTITPGQDKVAEIEKLFLNDKLKLAEYNLQDAMLVTGIFRKAQLIELSVRRSQISGLCMDQLGLMTAAFDHFYLPRLHDNGYVAPNIKDITASGHAAGGYVIDPQPGIYDNVITMDFKSLYPSIIRSFKIDPLSRIESEINTIKTPGNYKFSSTNHLLPEFIEELMKHREEAKKKKDKQLSQAIKILMNSFYGVMGSYGCRFYHPNLPSAITGTGQWLLLGSKEFFEKKGLEVVYGDTDSLFVKLKNIKISESPEMKGQSLASALNQYWKQKLKEDFGVTSYLEIEFEKYYKKFIITPMRRSESGAKKRYTGLLIEKGNEKLEFVGMEFVRSDWTKLAKEFQVELYNRIFHEQEIAGWLKNTVRDVYNGKHNDKLVYRKRLRKDADDYVKNIPQHVKAARMIDMHSGVVNYVITQRGPIPIELKHNDIDYNHYIEKQIKPIADSVLVLLGESFDSIVQTGQLNIFDS